MSLRVLRLFVGCVSGLVAATARTEGGMCPEGKRPFGEYCWQEPGFSEWPTTLVPLLGGLEAGPKCFQRSGENVTLTISPELIWSRAEP